MIVRIAVIIFGLIIGSFLNVVIHRVPQGKSVVSPGSSCPSCHAPIRWWQNIPVLSWILLRGKCNHCKTTISVRYPVVELLTALLFLAALIRFGLSGLLLLRDLPFLALLIAISFIDLDLRIIPDRLSLPGLALGLVTSFFVPGMEWWEGLLGATLGFCIFYGLSWLYFKFSGKVGLGGGDVKLLAMIGAFLGPSGVFWTIFISSVWGSLVGVGYGMVFQRGKVMGVTIPYGPFLVIGALCYYFFGDHPWFQFMRPI